MTQVECIASEAWVSRLAQCRAEGFTMLDLLTGIETTAYVEPVGVGDALPDMPAYPDRTVHVPVPLEATYQAAWATCPADMRELVETGKLAGEGE